MKKYALLVLFLFPFFLPNTLHAQTLVKVNNFGAVTINVLAVEDSVLNLPNPNLDVKNAAGTPSPDGLISLAKENDKINMVVGEAQMDVTSWKDYLVELEERPETKQVKIMIKEGKFAIEQSGLTALTDYPISINTTKNTFFLTTPTGDKKVLILPFEALQGVYRARIITQLEDKNLSLKEFDNDLAYEVKGMRTVNMFNILTLDIPVKTTISASSGEVIAIEQPKWLTILGFLFV